MSVLVTFDSNVWRPACEPEIFPKDPDHNDYRKIRNSMKSGDIIGRLSETVFTLEGIQRAKRKAALGGYRPKINIDEDTGPDGQIKLTLRIMPDRKAHPGNNPFLEKHLKAARNLGCQVMRCPRIAAFVNPDIPNEYYVDRSNIPNSMNTLFGEVSRKIEAKGAGMTWVKTIGNKYATSD